MESVSASPPKLMDRVRMAIRAKHYSRRTEQVYVDWSRRYIIFHGKRHPSELGASHVAAFLTSLAVDGGVAASTQNQALSALLFLYGDVLHTELGDLGNVPRAKASQHVPVVMSAAEVRTVLACLSGVARIVASLLYGCGLRLQECLELRVKDTDMERREVTVRRGKGQKDRRVMLPGSLVSSIADHLATVGATHHADLAAGHGRVVLPDALARKYPGAPTEWRPLGKRIGHPHRPGVARARGRQHDDDLHTGAEPWATGRDEPARSAVTRKTAGGRQVYAT